MRTNRRACAATLNTFAVMTACVCAGDVSPRVIITDGDPNPSHPAETLDRLGTPTISQAGVVGFTARTRAASLNDAVFTWDDGLGLEVIREGDPLADHPALLARGFGTPLADETGQVGFYADFSSSGGTGSYIVGPPDALRLVAIQGDVGGVPDPPYVRDPGELGTLLLTRSGTVAFEAGGQSVRDIWSGTPGAMVMVAEAAMDAPGYPSTSVGQFGWTRTDEGGRVSTRAALGGAVSGSAVLRAGPSGAAIPAGSGLPAVGLDVAWVDTSIPGVNGAGRIGFVGFYEDPPDSGDFQSGAWTGPDDALELIATSGDAAPGLPEGYVFDTMPGVPLVTRSGGVSLVATAVAEGRPMRTGVWRWRDDDLVRLAATGDDVVNMPVGTTWLQFSGSTVALAANDHGRVVFIGFVDTTGDGVVAAILTVDERRALVALAVVGAPLKLAPGDVRIISEVAMYHGNTSGSIVGVTGDDGYGSPLNDAGQFVCRLSFEDDTDGLFLFDLGCRCVADVDCDGDVGTSDLMILLRSWGPCASSCASDVNTDGTVDFLDLVLLLRSWGSCP